MQRRLASRIGFGVLGVALGILVSNGSLLLVGQNPPSRLKLPNIPQAPVSYPGIPVRQAQGVPAMRPTRAGVVPAFSADELQRFLTSNSVPLGIKGTPYSINRVDCSLTAGK